MATPLLACMALVASMNQLPPRVMPAIALVEGGRPGEATRNRDGTEDLGPMQVNTRWLPVIAWAMHTTIPQVRARLLADACFNVSAGGAILRTYLVETGGDLLQAIGDYHSHTPPLNLAYRALVLDAARRLFARPSLGTPHAAVVRRMDRINFMPMHRISFTPVG
jgi:hypothetical protein